MLDFQHCNDCASAVCQVCEHHFVERLQCIVRACCTYVVQDYVLDTAHTSQAVSARPAMKSRKLIEYQLSHNVCLPQIVLQKGDMS